MQHKEILDNAPWVSEEEVDTTGLTPCGNMVVVLPVRVKEKTKGGIILADTTKDDIHYLTTVGKVLAMGPMCFIPKEKLGEPWYKVGDYIAYGKHDGIKVVYKGAKLILLRDIEALAIITNPLDMNPALAYFAGV